MNHTTFTKSFDACVGHAAPKRISYKNYTIEVDDRGDKGVTRFSVDVKGLTEIHTMFWTEAEAIDAAKKKIDAAEKLK